MSAQPVMNPFAGWMRLMSIGGDMQRTWFDAVETMHASHRVIDARAAIVRKAGQSPLTANYRELSRMVPEKVDAFSRSGVALAHGLVALQSAWLSQGQTMAGTFLSGRPFPWAGWAGNSLETLAVASRIGAATLAPIHRTATMNARRLDKRKKAMGFLGA